MTYLSLLEEEGVNSEYLIICRPARQVSSWTLHSGSVYYADFSYGFVYAVSQSDTSLTSYTSTSLSAGQYYWDDDNSRLYVRMSDSSNPSTKFVSVTYELYFGTYDAHWYRTPSDIASKSVYFDPLVARVPQIKASIDGIAFGVIPSQRTAMILNNADKVLNKHLYDSSFFNKGIEVWHWIGELDVANLKLVLSGFISDQTWSDSTVSFNIFDPVDIFNKEFRSQTNAFYLAANYAELDPQYEGKPVRYVYGVVDGFVPVNADYKDDAPTTSDNRVWKIRADGANSHAITRTVPASPSSTTTRTYLDSVVGFQVGDTVWIDKATDEYREVTVVGADYIEHAALGSGAAATSDTVKRGTVSRFEVLSQGISYLGMYNRDYTESVDAFDVLTVTLSASLESNLSIPKTLSPDDSVFCRVYGKTNNVTLGGPSFGSNNAALGNLTSLSPIFLDVLKRFTGIAEAGINSTYFTSCLTDAVDDIGIAIPQNSSGAFPKLKDIIGDLCETGLIKLFLDFDGKWCISRLQDIAATTKAIDESEIIEGTSDYSFEGQDIYSDVVVSFDYREKSAIGEAKSLKLEKSESNVAKYLHGVSKTLTHTSLHIDRSQAATLALRLSDLFGDRQGTYSFGTKNRFFNSVIDEKIELTRKSLPGFVWDNATDFSRDFSVQGVEKSLRQVTITMLDLKGVQDNSGDF